MATIIINGVTQGTGAGPDNLLKDACGAASAGATVSIVDGDYTTKNEEISIGRNITLEADAANPNTVRIWRISFTSGTLTFSKKTFELFRDANGYASLKMSSGTSLALDSATVDCKRITLLGSNTITLNNSTLSIYEFTGEGLRGNVTLTGSTVTVGTSGKSLEFYEANKTILLDLNSTLDVSGSIYAKNHDSTYAGTINISTTGLGEASKNTYQLLIVGGSISTSEVTVNIDGSSISGYSDNSVYSGDYKFTTLGGHGVYLTKLDNSTVYLDPAYTRIGQKPNGNDNLLIGLNAKNNISVVGAATSQIYLTKGNDSTSSYGNLNLSSQEVNTTITTTGGLGKCRLPRLLDDERGS